METFAIENLDCMIDLHLHLDGAISPGVCPTAGTAAGNSDTGKGGRSAPDAESR